MMEQLLQNLLTADLHGSIVILAVLLLRLVLRRTPKKYICILWMLAGLRLLLPLPLESRLSLQPQSLTVPGFGKFLPIIAILYGLFALGILGYSLVSYLHLKRQVADAVKIRGGWESDKIETAFVLGFLKPKIYIPAGMDENQRRQILAHERTHLDKGDHWIKLIGFLALALHWYNPLVWLAYAFLCKDMEMACDERVVRFMEPGERKAYSSALLECSTKNVHYAACPVAFGEVSVKYRILSILNYRKPSFWVSLLGVLAIVFVALCLGTNQASTPEDPEAPLVEAARETPETFAPAKAPESPENPDWGITAYIRDLTSMGGTMVLDVKSQFFHTSENLKISDSSLETWDGSGWIPVESQSVDRTVVQGGFGFGGSYSERAVDHMPLDMNWALNYGTLPGGDYQVKMTLTTDNQSGTFYVPFHIYRETLPSKEEAALARCTQELTALKASQGYSVLLYQKNAYDDDLSPRQRITFYYSKYRVDYYAGEYLASSSVITGPGYSLGDWQTAFSLDTDRKYLFPEGQSKIENEEISFRSAWADYQGISYLGTDSFTFDTSGNLTSIDRLTETADGEIVSHIRLEVLTTEPYTASFYIQELDTLDYNSNTGSASESPWKIWFRVDDDLLNPKGSQVWVAWEGVGAGDYRIDDCFWLEQKTEKGWTRLLGEDVTAPFGYAFQKLSSRTQYPYIDWSDTYGALPSGVYRMGARFFHGEESIIQYSEFAISPTGGIFGDGSEAAMARVDAAIEKLRTGSYHAIQMEDLPQYNDTALTQEYWHCGDELATDYYNGDGGTYHHSVVERTDGAEPAINEIWYKYSYSLTPDDPYESIYFPEGNSVISDQEVTFLFSYSQTAGSDPCNKYTYRFDEAGNLTEIIEYFNPFSSQGNVYRYLIDYPEDSVIQAHIDSVRK